jgi:hypothetical protein
LGAIALALLSALASNAQAQVVIFGGFDQSVGNPASGSPLGWVVGDASNPNTFEHFTLNLTSDFGDGLPDTFDPLSEWWQVDFNMMSQDFGDPSTGDQLIISNLELTMVPEPSSLALCALSAVAGLAFLRRRTMHSTYSLFWQSITRPGAHRQDGGAAGSGAVRWGETPGEPLVGQIVRFPACEDARPTNFLAKLYRDRAAASISRLSCLVEA